MMGWVYISHTFIKDIHYLLLHFSIFLLYLESFCMGKFLSFHIFSPYLRLLFNYWISLQLDRYTYQQIGLIDNNDEYHLVIIVTATQTPLKIYKLWENHKRKLSLIVYKLSTLHMSYTTLYRFNYNLLIDNIKLNALNII